MANVIRQDVIEIGFKSDLGTLNKINDGTKSRKEFNQQFCQKIPDNIRNKINEYGQNIGQNRRQYRFEDFSKD